ncbi:alpha/beta fold hydrolase [Pararobbsia silviterrae]|uniref:Alpha/beta hydrolase n=1 Tax=Pararobbsia silviterrae TaxID=1792498 RepID=A0A494X9A6_9BURK|nr:alpha/beta hydrolase [Pararobbsia silviterrae]RKP47040.1 alpha/beta hydrolase [Pararobbsia silviterrae]
MADHTATKHIVLIHGAWQGSWSFDAWRPWLERAGWRTHAVDLPGNGWGPTAHDPANLSTYTDHVVATLDALDAPAVVLGHSGGGITASQVAEAAPDRVIGLVYLAGMMLASGQSFADLVRDVARADPDAPVAGISPYLDTDRVADTTRVRPEGALACFLQDCEPQAAQRAIAMLRAQPESGRRMMNHLTPERFGRVPRIYVECRNDASVTLPLQRAMQHASPGAHVLSLACGHVPQLVQTEALSQTLIPELDALHRVT